MFKAVSSLMSILLIGLSACTAINPATSTPTGTSGIEGNVTIGPTCPGPVRIDGTECKDKPYQATISVLAMDGSQVTRFQTDANGYFKIPLSPGTYILHPESDTPMPHTGDQSVVISEGQYTLVSVMYDTGMR